MTGVEVNYAELSYGDVVVDHDTFFCVTGVKSFERTNRTVWLVTSVAISEPHRVFAGMVNKPGDVYQFQGSGVSARALCVSFSVRESAGGDQMYERVTQAVVDGSPCRITYRIDIHQHASLRVGDLSVGEERGWYELGNVKDADLPGVAAFSKRLGKLIRF